MFTVPDYITNASKAGIEAQISAFTALSRKSLESIEKIAHLNINLSKELFAQSAAAVDQLINAKGPQEFMQLTASQAKPQAEKVSAYGRELTGMAIAAKTELSQESENHIADARRRMASLVDEASKTAPASVEPMVKAVKSAFGTADASFNQFSRSAKQAADTFDANVINAVSKISEAAEKAVARSASR